MSGRDEPDAEVYADPANQLPVGPGRRRTAPRRPLTGHVPVRFDDRTIAAVKERAEADGMTVSAWIRRLVARELTPTETVPTSGEAVVVRVPVGARRVVLELDGPGCRAGRTGR